MGMCVVGRGNLCRKHNVSLTLKPKTGTLFLSHNGEKSDIYIVILLLQLTGLQVTKMLAFSSFVLHPQSNAVHATCHMCFIFVMWSS